MWVAVKPFRYRNVSYKAGDEVPAERWPNRRALVVTHRIRQTQNASPIHSPEAPLPVLSKFKRQELNEYAASLGIENAADPNVYPNRETLTAAIEKKLDLQPSAPSADTNGGPAPSPTTTTTTTTTLPPKPVEDDEDPFSDLDVEGEDDSP